MEDQNRRGLFCRRCLPQKHRDHTEIHREKLRGPLWLLCVSGAICLAKAPYFNASVATGFPDASLSVYIVPGQSQKLTMPIYDITVPIRPGMPIYEGDPAVEIAAWSALRKGDSANVSFLHFGAHTGTHVDAPAHFIEGARKIDALSLDVLIGPARVVRVPDEVAEINSDFISAAD